MGPGPADVRFQALHKGRCFIATAKRGWVTNVIFAEWAELFCEWLERHRIDMGLQGKPAILVLDNAPTRACARALETFRAHNVHVVTFPPHLTHVLQPIDVSWARAFKTFLRDWLRINQKLDRRADQFRALGSPLEGASQAQQTKARLVFSVIDAAQPATTMGLSMAAFRVCGICPYSAAPVLASRYIRRAEKDAELADRAANPHRLSTGPQILTPPEFLGSLR
jgi:hypothetical protein